MEVILRQDVENLGFEYEIVTVKPGYARNYLIPRGKATLATPERKEELAKTLESRRAEEEKLIAAAQELAAKLEGLEVKIEAKVGSGDKLFGSVNNADLAEALNNAGVEVERKHIRIPGNTIKRIGRNMARIRFHREVETEFEFDIIPDEDSIKRAEAAAKAKADVARMDAERAAAEKVETDTFANFENPLFANQPKKEETPAPEAEVETAPEAAGEETAE